MWFGLRVSLESGRLLCGTVCGGETPESLGKHTSVIDGDIMRKGLCKDLGFDEKSRIENIRRAAEVSWMMVDAGLIVLAAFISPFATERAMSHALVGKMSLFKF